MSVVLWIVVALTLALSFFAGMRIEHWRYKRRLRRGGRSNAALSTRGPIPPCPVDNCRIKVPHSHAAALVRRIKEG